MINYEEELKKFHPSLDGRLSLSYRRNQRTFGKEKTVKNR